MTCSQFLYKSKLVLKTTDPDVIADNEAVELLYLQAIHDIVTYRYPVKEKDITALAALQVSHMPRLLCYCIWCCEADDLCMLHTGVCGCAYVVSYKQHSVTFNPTRTELDGLRKNLR